MFVTCLEVFALKDQDWLQVSCDVLWNGKFVCALEVLNTNLEQVKNVSIENAPKHQVVRSLFLVASYGKQTAIVLDSLVFDQRGVFHGDEVVIATHQHLNHVSSLHQLEVLKQIIECLARATTLHQNALLVILLHLRFSILENLTTLVSGCSALDSELVG